MIKSIKQLHEEFMAEHQYAVGVEESTLRGYKSVFILFDRLMPETKIDQIDTATMVEFFRRLDTRLRKAGHVEKVGVEKSTVATYRSKLNKFFNWLKVHGHIEKNPFDIMEYPDVRYDDIKWLRQEQVKKILAAVMFGVIWMSNFDRVRNIAIIFTLLLTGVRAGELVGLEVTDVDLERREITIRGQTSKSKMQRIIPIHPKLKMLLIDYLNARRTKGFATPKLFTSSRLDEGFSINGLKNIVERLVSFSGVKFHPHLFRHTFAVNFLVQGGDISQLKQLLGHRSIKMTVVYLRCLPTSSMRSKIDTLDLDTLA